MSAFGAGALRAWWARPQVDWSLSGELRNPEQRDWIEGAISLSNFGDGPAHRVSVYIQRGDAPRDQIIGTSARVGPGESFVCETGVMVRHYESTRIWVTWTPPPIRRRREQRSSDMNIHEHLELSDMAARKLKTFNEERASEAGADG